MYLPLGAMSVTVVVVWSLNVEDDEELHLNPVVRETDPDTSSFANSSLISALQLISIEVSMLVLKLCSSEYVAPVVTVYVQSALDLEPSVLSQTTIVFYCELLYKFEIDRKTFTSHASCGEQVIGFRSQRQEKDLTSSLKALLNSKYEPWSCRLRDHKKNQI